MSTGTALPAIVKRSRNSTAFKRILVAVTQQTGPVAIEMAARFATPGVSRVRVLHLQRRITYPSRAGQVILETFEEAKDFASRMQAELRELGVDAETEVGREVSGHEAEQILRSAFDFNAELIIAGNHRKSGLDALLRGSTTRDIVRKSPLTLLLVPEIR